MRYRNKPVIYNLTNEPHDQEKALLVSVQNEAIAAIRDAGATQLVLASGGAWSGAHSWESSGNAEAMLGIRDPRNNFAFDVHQYLDQNASGTSGTCVANSGNRLTVFTAWARKNGKRGFLGEFGGGANSACNTDEDCGSFNGFCYPLATCGEVAMNASANEAEWDALHAMLETECGPCGADPCGACTVCNFGTCGLSLECGQPGAPVPIAIVS